MMLTVMMWLRSSVPCLVAGVRMSIDLGNRIISPHGQVQFKPSGLEVLLYQGIGFDRIMAEPCDDVVEWLRS